MHTKLHSRLNDQHHKDCGLNTMTGSMQTRLAAADEPSGLLHNEARRQAGKAACGLTHVQ